METSTPCYTKSDEFRLPPEIEGDDPDCLLTDMEKRLNWLCEAWNDAQKDDTFDEWHSVRMMIHGASMALVHCRDKFDDRLALGTLGSVAFEYGLTCIQQGKYEGAPAQGRTV